MLCLVASMSQSPKIDKRKKEILEDIKAISDALRKIRKRFSVVTKKTKVLAKKAYASSDERAAADIRKKLGL